MVRGIEQFQQAFAQFAGNYVIIGGTACELHEDLAGLTPRATRDIDVILIVEALSHDFVAQFWEFVKAGGYTEQQIGEEAGKRHQYYRFKSPANRDFPSQIELFSRSLGIFNVPEGVNLTPVPTDADLSSLSAILMDDEYYQYTIDHSEVIDDVHIANIESLIVLKCRAYLDMVGMRATGCQVDSKHIKKHRNDVFRMVAALPSGLKRFALPPTIYKDVDAFCQSACGDMPDRNLIRDMGLVGVTPEQLLERLRDLFEPLD